MFAQLLLLFFLITSPLPLRPLNARLIYKGQAYGIYLYCSGGPELASKEALLKILFVITPKKLNNTFYVLNLSVEIYNSSKIIYANSTSVLLNIKTREVYKLNGEMIGITGFYLTRNDIENKSFIVTSFEKYKFVGRVVDDVRLVVNKTDICGLMISSAFEVERGQLAFNYYYDSKSLLVLYMEGFIVDALLYSVGIFMIANLDLGFSLYGNAQPILSTPLNPLNLMLILIIILIASIILFALIYKKLFRGTK